MFNSNKILSVDAKTAIKKANTSVSAFGQRALEMDNARLTANGGVALKTTNNQLLDQFASTSNYLQPRTYENISRDMQLIYSIDKENALKFVMYLRLISRKVKFFDGSETNKVQNGQGLKHESIMRMMWLSQNDPKAFYDNLELFVNVGSFKDIITMMRIDVRSNGFEDRKLDWGFLGKFLQVALATDGVSDLVKKYLPQIKASTKQTTQDSIANTIIAKYLCSVFFGSKANGSNHGTYTQYRKLKSSGTAHQWQQLISRRDFDKLNFNTIAGRALNKLSGGKFLSNQGLESNYLEWLDTQPIAKYTGYVHELLGDVKSGYRNLPLTYVRKMTINKQFETLVKLGLDGLSETDNGFIAVVDTSSSMTSYVTDKLSAYDIAKSLALYMSSISKSKKFGNEWIEFNDVAKLHTWVGKTTVDKLWNDRSESYGSTSIIGVAHLFTKILKSGISESDFPSGIVCFSDGEFNGTGGLRAFQAFREQMLLGGFSSEFVENFKIVLWDIRSYASSTPIQFFDNDANSYQLSGYDASVLKFILGTEEQVKTNTTPKTPNELMEATLGQEIFSRITI